MSHKFLFNDKPFDAIEFLKSLIAIPSYSREEMATADLFETFFDQNKIKCSRIQNNVWVKNKYFDARKKTLLLNSHHDTVKPNGGYTNDPFQPFEKDGKLFGLGSNDAGGPLVSLLATFLSFYDSNLAVNIIFAASAEEEISGANGIELLLKNLPEVDMAIVGEPTEMKMAVAEKGLIVLDCISNGKAGHAARDEGDNAIYKAIKDIEWFKEFSFPKSSGLLGPVHIAVTSIETNNKAHNVVPAQCRFVVDIRVNEMYTLEEIVSIIKANVLCDVIPRSTRLQPSFINNDHPLVVAGKKLKFDFYGSPTCSDMALMNLPAIKIGPGDSVRSHTADEYIFVDEIRFAIEKYISIINEVSEILKVE